MPESEQDAIASIVLEEIEDKRCWDLAFAHFPDVLAKLAVSAMVEHYAGKTQELDPEKL